MQTNFCILTFLDYLADSFGSCNARKYNMSLLDFSFVCTIVTFYNKYRLRDQTGNENANVHTFSQRQDNDVSSLMTKSQSNFISFISLRDDL